MKYKKIFVSNLLFLNLDIITILKKINIKFNIFLFLYLVNKNINNFINKISIHFAVEMVQ
jgi:hypothetical protein